MRALLFLVLGLVIGGVGASLFVRSLPPPQGTEAAKIVELERVVERNRLRIATLEATEANAAARLEAQAASGRRSIFQDLKDGRPVDVNDLFTAAKPFLHEFAPLTDRMRMSDTKRRIGQTVADLGKRWGLDDAQQSGLREWLEERAARQAEAIREVTGRADSTFVDYAKAMRDFHPNEGVDEFMERTLQGDSLAGYKTERMAERVNHVQYEAERRVEQLNAVVSLDDQQQDQVFALMARGSPEFDPSMQFEGLGDDRAVLSPGQSRDQAILAVLRPDQREQYEAHRARQRQEAEAEAAEIGLKLPPDWDMFDR